MVRLVWPGWWLGLLVGVGTPVAAQAVPVLTNGAGARPAAAERLDSLRLRCGEFQAYWDGKYLDGRGEATPGVYYYQLTVDGERFTRKMIAQKRVTSQH